jgi:two-component system response regulator YesN
VRAETRISPQVIRTMHVIESRYVEPTLQVGAVAQDLGVSTEHLCRVLKRHTGLTFVTLLRRTRVRAACRLLQTTTLSMKEIASRAGFSSASRFDRDFKMVCGVSPSRIAPGSGVGLSGYSWWLVFVSWLVVCSRGLDGWSVVFVVLTMRPARR